MDLIKALAWFLLMTAPVSRRSTPDMLTPFFGDVDAEHLGLWGRDS
jgi:hypothetical protein